MKTIILHIPDESSEAEAMAELAEMQRRNLIKLDGEVPLGMAGPALTAQEFAEQLQQALDSPAVSWEEARARFGL